MATLFNKVLESGTPPSSWAASNVVLLHKKGDTSVPSNFRMIALSSCIGKIYHQIIADRLHDYIIDNELVNTEFQKAFLKGKNGCVEHNQVLHEVISHSKANNRTVHITWFDLEDAFGSVSHDLIKLTLQRNLVPSEIQTYILNLYSALNGRVTTKQWSSDSFEFRKGIFQGDPLSPIIFILCFNPIIRSLESNLKYGYSVNDTKIITAPFADDFCLITGNKRTHQRLINTISDQTKSMGLKLKPSKCRSLSVCGGTATSVPFYLSDDEISTLDQDPHMFLGSLITFRNKPAEVYDYIHEKLSSGLDRIDKSLIRNEHKLRVYADYLLPSLRFHLTVNDMCISHLNNLDTLVNRFLKKWSGLPHPGTLAFLHMPNGLAIKRIADVYYESHTAAHISSRMKGGEVVNQCLDSRLEREKKWSSKKSVVCKSEDIFQQVSQSNESIKACQNAAKKVSTDEISHFWHDKVKSLLVQGRFLDLLCTEATAYHWKSVLYNLPVGVCKFVINSLCDTLNNKANLKRWGKALNDKCSLCKNRATLHHILNYCSVSLEQGRFTWRHNNILQHICKTIISGFKPDNCPEILCDINEFTKGKPTTVPIECTITNLIPDLCMFWKSCKKLVIIELTVPFELNIDQAHKRKLDKYTALVSDIKSNGFECDIITLEIGSRGYISPDNQKRLKSILKLCNNPASFKSFRDDLSKLAILSSFSIFHAHKEPSWDNYPLLSVSQS